jgi:hypothetical protein
MMKFISAAMLTVSFFVISDAARAQGCPPPKNSNHPIIKCAIANGATWQYDNRYGRCLWIAPYQREMTIIDCGVQAARRRR